MGSFIRFDSYFEHPRKPLYFRRIDENHADDIEADLIPRRVRLAYIFASHAAQVLTFLLAHGTIGRTIFAALPRLHLDENQFVSLPSDDIGLRIARRESIIPRDDRKAFAL